MGFKRIFILFENDKVVKYGLIEEIAEFTGVAKSTIYLKSHNGEKFAKKYKVCTATPTYKVYDGDQFIFMGDLYDTASELFCSTDSIRSAVRRQRPLFGYHIIKTLGYYDRLGRLQELCKKF